MNQTFKCQIYNRVIDSNIDQLRCNIQKFAADLYYYDFGNICMVPLGLIVIISIFGGIKANYRWFILNQAIWDISVSYQFSCANVMRPYIKPGSLPTCFYFGPMNNIFWLTISLILITVVMCNQYSSIFLLSVSRFMAFYWTRTYNT